jgi:hypothetical protein
MSGLTVEMVNEMQDAMNKIGDDEESKSADASKAADASDKSDKAKPDEDAAKAADAKDEGKKDGDDTNKDKKDEGKEGDEGEDTVQSLREQLRESNAKLRSVESNYSKLHKTLVDKGVITAEEIEADKKEEEAAEAAYKERQDKLNEMVSLMEINPNYADVRAVCTQGNLDDLVDAFSRFYVKENSTPDNPLKVADVAAKMEQEIWAEANPYKKIYELVKKFHPKYAVAAEKKEEKKEDVKEDAAKIAADADKVKGKDGKVVDANPSAANLGAGGSGAGTTGWTSARIDALPEDELHTVPRDIYDKYLKGTLN